jgi:hypothetical protein
MKFMVMVRANESSEAGCMPSEELIGSMAKFNEEMAHAGVLVDAAGLHPSSNGMRIRFAQGKKTLIDGPFAEAKELIAGYWLINVKSKAEAIEWLKQVPSPFAEADGVVEMRQLYGMEDFEPSAALDHQKEIGKRLAEAK